LALVVMAGRYGRTPVQASYHPAMPEAAALSTARTIAGDIKLAHSVFALPFAVLAAFMAATPGGQDIVWSRFAGQLTLVVVAMILARTAAMLSNRLLDRRIDAANPRTAGRALPSGRVSVTAAVATLTGCSLGFMVVCVAFGVLYGNWWPTWLGLPVLAWINAYALLKRFSALCHLYLGASLAISPVAAALAIDPAALGEPAVWLLAAMVLGWVAGFDVIYALQDVDVDREQGLHSLPARLGVRRAMIVSRGLHAGAGAALAAVAWIDPRLSVLFAVAVVLVVALLVYEHATVARWGTSRMALAFFTLNGVISCVIGVLGVIDVLV
jgi:4-hydroxybenzoate polyprenyltransferase